MTDDFLRYFPELSGVQREKLAALKEIYEKWNSKINVISRKDIENFNTHHVLHSLAISFVVKFEPGTTVLDIGTGGGFPGIPLSIMFPDTEFTLLDSIEKKIRVVTAVRDELSLNNVKPVRKRAEEEKQRFHFIVSRAVTSFPDFYKLARKNIHTGSLNKLSNGILYLKGGDLSQELESFSTKVRIWNISNFYSESFFETKKIVYLPV